MLFASYSLEIRLRDLCSIPVDNENKNNHALGNRSMSKVKKNVDRAEDAAIKPLEKRRVERLDSFAERTHAPYPSLPKIERKSLADIEIPVKQTNGNALRFALHSFDVFATFTFLIAGVWTGYIGTNGHGFTAPLLAGIVGATIYTCLLFLVKAYRFSPSERYIEHMRAVTLATFSALGVWLSTAMIAKPFTFTPYILARAGIITTAGIIILHTVYFYFIRKLHEKKALAPTIVMLGATETARRVIEENAKTHELNIIAIFDERITNAPADIHGIPIIGKID
ncbi:MAG: nucleoside-diphosphate sugar epimerase/dehydratase, partial [Maricaulaceae bacterium]